MLFFRQGMHDAIQTPLAFDVLQDAVSRFSAVRMLPTWQLAVDKKRTLPINGVSDAFVEKTTLLNRDVSVSVMRFLPRSKWGICSGWRHRERKRKRGDLRLRAGFSFPRIRRIRRYYRPLLPSGHAVLVYPAVRA
jgi:hypothetical protein